MGNTDGSLQVMPDVMTPESMVTKLDEFESMAEDAVSQEDRDVRMSLTHTANATRHACTQQE